MFGRLDRIAKRGAVLATNTSYLDIDTLARGDGAAASAWWACISSARRTSCASSRWCAAPPTSRRALATAIAVARRLGKVPVVVGVCHGFVGNRMLRVRSVEAERLLLEGALPQEVDAALIEFGFPMGPFAMADLAGLDVSWRMRKAQGHARRSPIALCELGRFGQKTGARLLPLRAGLARRRSPTPRSSS